MSHEAFDTQGNIVRGYKHLHHTAYLFCEIRHRSATRRMLRRLARSGLTTDERWPDKPSVHRTLNVAFTYSGLRKLGWGRVFGDFTDFREGMLTRATNQLGDTGPNSPEHWEPALRREADLLFTIYGDEPGVRDARLAEIRARLMRSGLSEVLSQRADTPPSPPGHLVEREHFGFADGFSQPTLEVSGDKPEDGPRSPEGEGALPPRSVLNCEPRWRPIKLGEFLLGHEDEDGVTAGGDDRHGVLRNGTFMVWRKLEQHVDRLESFLDASSESPEHREWVAAKIVGRWRNGTSLISAPYGNPETDPDSEETLPRNEFDYGGDPDGALCPLGAHVRRANPRVGLKWGTERTRRHRIIRRGMPYAEGDAGGTRGLVFVCFNASIARQFELIQGQWLMDGDAFGLGADRDFLLGHDDAEGKLTIQGDRSRPATFLRRPPAPFVTTRGGHYLFVPGVTALRWIATPLWMRIPRWLIDKRVRARTPL
jgi:Dyp-type peroxidase family